MWTASKSTVQTLPLVPVDLHGEGRFTHIGELRARTNRTIAAARPTATRMQLSIMGACTSAATATKPALTRTRRSTNSSFLWCGLRLKLPPAERALGIGKPTHRARLNNMWIRGALVRDFVDAAHAPRARVEIGEAKQRYHEEEEAEAQREVQQPPCNHLYVAELRGGLTDRQ
eukprot:scaffold1085_cov68-Phaeocystis_antarctica.AAC.1